MLGGSLITTIQKASLIITLSILIVFWAYHVSSYILLSALKTPASLALFLNPLNAQSEETAFFFSEVSNCLYREQRLGIMCYLLFFSKPHQYVCNINACNINAYNIMLSLQNTGMRFTGLPLLRSCIQNETQKKGYINAKYY